MLIATNFAINLFGAAVSQYHTITTGATDAFNTSNYSMRHLYPRRWQGRGSARAFKGNWTTGGKHIPYPFKTGNTVFTYSVSGGVVFGGTSAGVRTRVFVPSGGVVFGGTSAGVRTRVYVVSGGVVFGGVAATSYTPGSTVFTYSPSGGVILAGDAPRSRTRVPSVSGGVILAGTAPITRTRTPSISGGVVFGGFAQIQFIDIHIYTPSGGVVFGGTGSGVFVPIVGAAADQHRIPQRIRRRS